MFFRIIDGIVQLFTIINPFLMIIATIMWVKLHYRVTKTQNEIEIKMYILEGRIDYILNNSNFYKDYLDKLRELNNK